MFVVSPVLKKSSIYIVFGLRKISGLPILLLIDLPHVQVSCEFGQRESDQTIKIWPLVKLWDQELIKSIDYLLQIMIVYFMACELIFQIYKFFSMNSVKLHKIDQMSNWKVKKQLIGKSKNNWLPADVQIQVLSLCF